MGTVLDGVYVLSPFTGAVLYLILPCRKCEDVSRRLFFTLRACNIGPADVATIEPNQIAS